MDFEPRLAQMKKNKGMIAETNAQLNKIDAELAKMEQQIANQRLPGVQTITKDYKRVTRSDDVERDMLVKRTQTVPEIRKARAMMPLRAVMYGGVGGPLAMILLGYASIGSGLLSMVIVFALAAIVSAVFFFLPVEYHQEGPPKWFEELETKFANGEIDQEQLEKQITYYLERGGDASVRPQEALSQALNLPSTPSLKPKSADFLAPKDRSLQDALVAELQRTALPLITPSIPSATDIKALKRELSNPPLVNKNSPTLVTVPSAIQPISTAHGNEWCPDCSTRLKYMTHHQSYNYDMQNRSYNGYDVYWCVYCRNKVYKGTMSTTMAREPGIRKTY